MTSLSVVVPATDAPATLDACVRAIETAGDPPEELFIVEEPPGDGPAAARNAGAQRATGDIIVFVDSDVAVHRDVFRRIRAAFSADPGLVALFGSYDANPRPGGIVSDFRNLLHHHVHQSSAGEATTFWAGLGAIRRTHFVASGGFDAVGFPRPSIEDIELGMRLVERGGRVVLDPLVQGAHLKQWTLGTMIATDFSARGVPWVQLLLRQGSGSTALNLGWRHRATAVASVALSAAVVRRKLGPTIGLLVVVTALNGSFYRLLLRQRGPLAAAAGLPLHILHHLIGVAALPAGATRHLRERSTAFKRPTGS